MNRLESQSNLRSALEAVLAGPASAPGNIQWMEQLRELVEFLREATPAAVRDDGFLDRLWNDNVVAAVGNGTVKVSPALNDDEFVLWFSNLVMLDLSPDPAAAESRLVALYDELMHRLRALCGRTPRLKANRVLCVIFPDHFTTVADVGALRYLHGEMGGSVKDHPVHAHMSIRRRIDEVLGPVSPTDPLDPYRRMCLPWLLYARLPKGQTPATEESGDGRPKALMPLPATLRRKGLTAMRGGFTTLLSYLQPLQDGLSREDFNGLIGTNNSELSERSYPTFINGIAREFDLCIRDGDTYRLSARGLNLLESQDANELADHLLTRVLGLDHVIVRLAQGPAEKTVLVSLLQSVNPGWTSTFAPTAQIGWLVSLGAIEPGEDRRYRLTELGRRWHEFITWEPQSLPTPPKTVADLRTVSAVQIEPGLARTRCTIRCLDGRTPAI